ncbi:hypothetical protein GRI72_02800 [Altererythrobacter marinus]|uniref:Uncharacterized protein n=1 Tax=Pelagerythrobacter marinus TaxID=538382 RepID=A0ABW9UUW8_9SPHN|nr:hypothetical protein [Pelagerythrobacter marinus]MXO67761.1 hypothetical protein [Pelagerythrobacter marinus]
MTAQSPIKPTTPEHRLADAAAEELIADVMRLHGEVGNLLAALTRSGGEWSIHALHANLAAVRAAQVIWNDDLEVEADNTEAELPEYRVAAEFNPSRVHPNDLCQSKGYV